MKCHESRERKWVPQGCFTVLTIKTQKNILFKSWIKELFSVLTLFIFLFIEFIGVTPVTKIMHVSGAQFDNISVHCVVCPTPSQVSIQHHLFIHVYPPPPPPTPTLPSNHHTVVCVCEIFLFLSFFCSIPLPSPPEQALPHPNSCQPAFWVCQYFIVSSFCPLDSAEKWNNVVLTFLWLISLSIMSNYGVAKGKMSFFLMAR